jgi:hypothetical protein
VKVSGFLQRCRQKLCSNLSSVTYSATAAPFLDTVLVSTTKTTVLASARCSRNWSLTRGWPGISISRMVRFAFEYGKGILDELVCSEVCVGRVSLYTS